jgi:hypothetical protein
LYEAVALERVMAASESIKWHIITTEQAPVETNKRKSMSFEAHKNIFVLLQYHPSLVIAMGLLLVQRVSSSLVFR